jgi:hypothetical protein
MKRSPISQALIEVQKASDKASQALPEYEALRKAKAAKTARRVVEALRYRNGLQTPS